MGHQMLFPFTAVVGQDQVKEALLIAMVNPKVGGVLIAGEKGSAKSTIVRGLAEVIPDTCIINIPLNATEDMVFGSMDIEYAVVNGQRRFSPGILAKAHENVLYIDEINLLRRDLVNAILDTSASGVNIVEREGISHQHDSRYTIIGTMNPEEGTLSSAVLDRFGLYAAVNREKNIEARVEILRRILAYERQPDYFQQQYYEKNEILKQQMREARAKIEKIEVTEAMMHLAAQLCTKARCAGHRAEIFLLEAAKSIAALANREYLLPNDVDRAALFVLPHRMRQEEEPSMPEQDEQDEQDEQENQEDNEEQSDEQQDELPQPPEPPTDSKEEQPPDEDTQQQESEPSDNQAEQESEDNGKAQEQTADIDKNFSHIKMAVSLPQDRQMRSGNGKRSLTRTDTKQGRYVRSGIPGGKVTDVAFDATLRAAAPYQRTRTKGNCFMTIQQEDLRQKVREKRIGNTFLFVVDASGSMGAKQRMRAVKGAIFSMLQDAYQKRDQVGLIAFRRQTAEILLPITRSVDLAQKCLQYLPTGGKTPLAEGLYMALSMLQSMQKKEKEMKPIIVLVTDGRANSGGTGTCDAITDALTAAGKLKITGVHSMVIDTENDFIKLAVAQSIAREMGSTYYKLQELSDKNIINIVKNIQ